MIITAVVIIVAPVVVVVVVVVAAVINPKLFRAAVLLSPVAGCSGSPVLHASPVRRPGPQTPEGHPLCIPKGPSPSNRVLGLRWYLGLKPYYSSPWTFRLLKPQHQAPDPKLKP